MNRNEPGSPAARADSRHRGRLPSLALDRLTWREAEAALRRDPRLIVPAGALEQHGPHLPLGTNTLIASRVARDISEALQILRAPPVPYGVNVPSGRRFPGTASLHRKTLHRLINDLLEGWEDQGVREFILITAHRYTPHLDALLLAFTSKATIRVIDLYAIEVADLLAGPPEPQHAGELETSLMLYLYPDLVRTDRVADFSLPPASVQRYMRGRLTTPPPGWQGAIGSPASATAETGRRIYERFLEAILAALSGNREP